jgi:hypothetical protein
VALLCLMTRRKTKLIGRRRRTFFECNFVSNTAPTHRSEERRTCRYDTSDGGSVGSDSTEVNPRPNLLKKEAAI